MTLNEEINRQQKLMGIDENPHRIKAREFGDMDYGANDAVAFEYRLGKMYLEPEGTHGGGVTSFYTHVLHQKDVPRYDDTSIHGRFWTIGRVISFYNYPANQTELLKVINDIYAEADVIRKVYPELQDFQIDYIEIPWHIEFDERPDKLKWDTSSFDGSPNFKIINVESYDKYINK